MANGRVAVFGPNPMLSITIEPLTAEGGDDIHVHAAGQGVWVARMAAELGAHAVLCGFIGGEAGTALRPLPRPRQRQPLRRRGPGPPRRAAPARLAPPLC